MLGFLGLEDQWVVAAYVLCLASTVLCVAYGLITWNMGEEVVKPEDEEWAKEEKEEIEEAM